MAVGGDYAVVVFPVLVIETLDPLGLWIFREARGLLYFLEEFRGDLDAFEAWDADGLRLDLRRGSEALDAPGDVCALTAATREDREAARRAVDRYQGARAASGKPCEEQHTLDQLRDGWNS
jgi:hypothetical protein